jgi:hypothetical protein
LLFQLASGEKEASPVVGANPSKPLDRFDGTTFPQYEVEQLYCHDLILKYIQLKHLESNVLKLSFSEKS